MQLLGGTMEVLFLMAVTVGSSAVAYEKNVRLAWSESGYSAPNVPANMKAFRGRNQVTFTFNITGSLGGRVYGGYDGVYSDDSELATAAVHAGMLKVGETKTLRVTVLPGRSAYTGSTANGVTSSSHYKWFGSFKFTDYVPQLYQAPNDMESFRGRNQETFTFNITGSFTGKLFGGYDGIYTDDSDLGIAAVHAGILKVGETKMLRVTVLPGQSSCGGNTANGVTSRNDNKCVGSFKFTDYIPTLYQAPDDMDAFRGRNKETFTFNITGSLAGNVWGGDNGIYTSDSTLATAAVHAGMVKVGETKTLRVTVLPGQSSYSGNTANGVTSLNRYSWFASYKFSKAAT